MLQAPRAKKTRVDLRFYVLVIQNSGLLVYLSFMAIVSLLAWVMSPFFHVLYLLDFFRRKSGRLVMRSEPILSLDSPEPAALMPASDCIAPTLTVPFHVFFFASAADMFLFPLPRLGRSFSGRQTCFARSG